MARQNSTITMKGKVGNVRGYKRTGSKHSPAFMGKPGGGDKTKFLNSVSMQRTRENSYEFGGMATQSGHMNQHLSGLYKGRIGRIRNVFTKLFIIIVHLGAGVRGFRTFALSAQKQMLLGIKIGYFNLKTWLNASFTAVLNVDNNELTVTFPTILANQLKFPRGATHFRITAGIFSKSDADIDLISKKYELNAANGDFILSEEMTSSWFPIGVDVVAPTVVATSASVVVISIEETVFGIVGLEFSQEVNGSYYPFDQYFSASIEVVG